VKPNRVLLGRQLLAAVVVLALIGSAPGDAADPKPEATAPEPKPEADASDASPDFGDDASEFAKDGECDDMRFTGSGMTQTALLDEDVRHDATDCRVAFEQDRLTFRGDDVTSPAVDRVDEETVDHIQWGDDVSEFARDGECDDMRFEGSGMTSTPLLVTDVQHDATDCRVAFRQGRLTLRE